MDAFYKELKKKIDDYFANTSSKQILKDIEKVRKNMKDMEPDIQRIVSENYWELL